MAGGIACMAMGIAAFFAPALMGIEDGTAEAAASTTDDVTGTSHANWVEPG